MGQAEIWQRARNADQKALRREEILTAAKRLFAVTSYEGVSLNGIAREAGMTKPNIYRYFAGREEIFLHILSEEQARFMEALEAKLPGLRGEDLEEQIAQVWVEQALSAPDLLSLLPRLGLSMEKNSSVEQLALFKKDGFARMAQLATSHHKIYPRLKVECWGEVISSIVALMAGFWPLCQGGDVVEQAMRHPEVGLEPWDFSSKMRFAVAALVRGASS